MSKAKGSKTNWEARASDVLAGRAKPDAYELLHLIHEVNPTGRGRHDKESAARYVQKARLQSLLIDRFADSLAVRLDPHDSGVVTILHRSGRLDACHAVIDALDDGARSWVRRKIDLGEDGVEEEDLARSAPRARDDEPDDADEEALDDPALLRAAGARAKETYDYERAERLYRRALLRGNDTASALALLEFLVDAIAADADALAVYRDLPTDARANPLARSLAGLAAARQGDETRALDLAAHAEDPRAADALTLVARSAIARGDDEAAARCLRDARVADAAHPELRQLEDQVRDMRAAARASEEEWLGELLASGRDDEARAKAASILEQFPESEPARRAATELETRRRANEGRRLLDEAEAARTKEDPTLALSLVARALAEPLRADDKRRAEALSKELGDEARARDAAQTADRIATWLGGADEARGLTAYVELDQAVRTLVHQRVSLPEIEWIDALGPARSSARTKATVEAALALKRAVELEGRDPAGIVAALTPHERILEPIALAKTLLDGARARRSEDRRRAILSDLDAATKALADRALDRAAALLGALERDLAAPDRERRDALRAELERLEHEQRLVRRLERARAARQWRDVETIARELASRAAEPARSEWQEEADTSCERARREVDLRVYDLDAGPELSRGGYLEVFASSPVMVVDLEAGRFWTATGGERLFLRAYDLTTKRLVRAYELRPPARSDEPHLQLSGTSLLALGGGWGALEIDRATGDPLRWISVARPNTNDERAVTMFRAAPGDRHVWYSHSDQTAFVADLEGERPLREVEAEADPWLLVGSVPPRVGVAKRGSLGIHDPSGHRTVRAGSIGTVWGAAQLPDDDGYFVLLESDPEKLLKQGFMFGEISGEGALVRSSPLDDVAAFPLATIASAKETGMVFLRCRNTAEEPVLRAYRRAPSSGGPLHQAYAIPVGDRRILAQDQDGRRAYLLSATEAGLDLVELGPEPPVLEEASRAHAFTPPLNGLLLCGEPPSSAASALFVEHFKWAEPAALRESASALRAAREGDRDGLVTLAWALVRGSSADLAEDLARALVSQHPGEVSLELLLWATLAAQRKWEMLRDTLEPVDPTELDERSRHHLYHLLAAARLGAGDVAGAERAIAEVAPSGKCKADGLREWIRAVSTPSLVGADGSVPHDLPTADQLRALIEAADAALARGDDARVLELYERCLPWEVGEAQALARLAEAHLALPATTRAGSLRKAIALERFLSAVHEARVGFRVEVIVPGATWSGERLTSIAARAREWIGGARDGA